MNVQAHLRWTGVVGVAVLVLAGATSSGCAHRAIAPSQGAMGMGLTNTEWHIEEVGGQPVLDRARTSLHFGSDGKVSGSTGCNNFNGTATIQGSRLTFSPLVSTRMACPGDAMTQEQKVLAALDATRAFSTDAGGDLRLLGGDGGTLLRLSRATP